MQLILAITDQIYISMRAAMPVVHSFCLHFDMAAFMLEWLIRIFAQIPKRNIQICHTTNCFSTHVYHLSQFMMEQKHENQHQK